MTKRRLFLARLKPEKVQGYIAAHDDIWPELEREYREAGVVTISCFLKGNDLYVYYEYDGDYLENKTPAGSPVDARWQAFMADFADKTVDLGEATEVYRMGQRRPPSVSAI